MSINPLKQPVESNNPPKQSNVKKKDQAIVEDSNTKQMRRGVHLGIKVMPGSTRITRGMAKILNFEVLKHGASFNNVSGILLNGADPSKGGSETGSTFITANQPPLIAGYVPDEDDEPGRSPEDLLRSTRGYFFVFRDTDKNTDQFNLLEQFRNTKLLAPTHAALSGSGQYPYRSNHQAVAMIANFCFSPTIEFMYSPEEIRNMFINDDDYHGLALKTQQELPSNRIGLSGVITHADSQRMKDAISTRPARFADGVVDLTIGFMQLYGVYYALSNRTSEKLPKDNRLDGRCSSFNKTIRVPKWVPKRFAPLAWAVGASLVHNMVCGATQLAQSKTSKPPKES